MKRRPPPDVQHVALVKDDGSVAIMYFVTRQYPWKLDPGWHREATDAAIQAEIERTGQKPVSWSRINPDDIPADRTHRNAWVWDGQRIVADESRIKPKAARTPSAPAAPTVADPTPIRAEMSAEIARVRKDFSQAVEKAYTDLAKRIERQSDIDPEELARQVQSVVSGEIDRAVAEAVQRIEERAPARTQLVEVEPGAFDETEPLPHFLDDWRKHGRERDEPEPETPEARRERAIRAIALAAEERRGAVTSPYPGKRDYYLRKAQIAFKQKMAPAQAYTDMLSTEAKRKGLTVDQLCDRIISRHYEAEAALQHIHDAEAEGTAAVMRATDEGIVAAERAAIERLASIGGDA